MGFSLKDRVFPGNVVNQFMSFCRDVDEFVNKDTLELFENRAQGVGRSVKRFYSNVVHDMLSCSGEIVGPRSHLVDNERVEKQVSLNQGSVHTLGHFNASLPFEIEPVMQLHDPPFGKISPRTETVLHLTESGVEEDISIDSCSENEALLPSEIEPVVQMHDCRCQKISPETEHLGESGAEEDITTDSCLNNEAFSGVSQVSLDQGSPHTSGYSTESLSIEIEPLMQMHDPPCGESSSRMKTVSHLRESGVEKDISTDSCLENKMFSGVSNEDHKHFTVPQSSSSENGPNGLSDSSSNDGRSLDSELTFNDKYPEESGSISVSSANIVNEDNALPVDLLPCGDANARASVIHRVHIMESTSADSETKTNTICPVYSGSISTPSVITAPDETSGVNVFPSFQIFKSNDNNETHVNRPELVIASSEKVYRLSEVVLPSSESEKTHEFSHHCDDDDDFDMDTIDLSPEQNVDETIIISQCGFTQSRRRNFRYYKNLINDALTSQKRISKEYKNLAILYGDTDLRPNSNRIPEPSSAPQILDTEWEMI